MIKIIEICGDKYVCRVELNVPYTDEKQHRITFSAEYSQEAICTYFTRCNGEELKQKVAEYINRFIVETTGKECTPQKESERALKEIGFI